jgi:hypothetical protein
MQRREALKKTLLAMGYTISVPAVLSIFESCNSNTDKTLKLEFLSASQATLVGEIAETILPRTQTPGAKDLHLDQFIDRMVKQLFSIPEQQMFLEGLDMFEKECKDMNGKEFGKCSVEQRHALLTKMETISEKKTSGVWSMAKKKAGPGSFYRRVKELSLIGYFTSEEIGKKLLVYDPVPGAYKVDITSAEPVRIAFE